MLLSKHNSSHKISTLKFVNEKFNFLEPKYKHKLIVFLENPYSFDASYYLNKYPDLVKLTNSTLNEHDNKILLKTHWVTHGLNEGRLCSKIHEDLCAKYNKMFIDQFLKTNYQIAMLPVLPKIIIVTRVSRVLEFANCVNSIVMQHYNNFHHILSYDDDNDLHYINALRSKNSTLIKVYAKDKDPNNYYYNLYCNTLLQHINMEGWILFLDDDDELIIPTILHKMSHMLVGCAKNRLAIFQNYRKDKIIKVADPRHPKIGEICISSFIFHTKYKHLSKFTDTQHGDYDFFIRLFRNKQMSPIFINYPIVKVNPSNKN